eukprot:8413984-Pyramimonas_sp.AAC.2
MSASLPLLAQEDPQKEGVSEAARNEPSRAVRKGFAAALAAVGKHAPEKRFRKVSKPLLSRSTTGEFLNSAPKYIRAPKKRPELRVVR